MESIITQYIEEQLSEFGDDITLAADDDLVLIGFDSIAYVRLIAFIHDAFGIRVPDAHVTVEQFGTVAAIASYLEANGAAVGEQDST